MPNNQETWSVLHPDEPKVWRTGRGNGQLSVPSLRTRIMSRITVLGPDDCWEWTGASVEGYGMVMADGKGQLVTRILFYWERGFWPEECRHTCDNPPCCNLAHLLDGDRSLNQQDAVERGRHANTRKTHCPADHPLVDGNLVNRKDGKRSCLTCSREQNAASKRAARRRRAA